MAFDNSAIVAEYLVILQQLVSHQSPVQVCVVYQ